MQSQKKRAAAAVIDSGRDPIFNEYTSVREPAPVHSDKGAERITAHRLQ